MQANSLTALTWDYVLNVLGILICTSSAKPVFGVVIKDFLSKRVRPECNGVDGVFTPSNAFAGKDGQVHEELAVAVFTAVLWVTLYREVMDKVTQFFFGPHGGVIVNRHNVSSFVLCGCHPDNLFEDGISLV